MKVILCCGLAGLLWLIQLAGLRSAQGSLQHSIDEILSGNPAHVVTKWPATIVPSYDKVLQFNVYKFTVTAADSGAVRNLVIKAYRGELLLTNFRIRVDGAVVGAEVADLDNNRFPELYIYSVSNGSGSFGRVYAWQFLPERKADITLANWKLPAADGYMGHDSLWVEHDILCRKYPIYQFGDANAEPSGGIQMKRYRLRSVGMGFTLEAE